MSNQANGCEHPTVRTASTLDFIAVVVGNALEFFDFTVTAFFAVFIGKAFSGVFSGEPGDRIGCGVRRRLRRTPDRRPG